MRVTEEMRTGNLLRNITSHSERLSRLYEKLATQQEVTRPSDNPVATSSIMRLDAHLKALGETTKAIDAAQGFLDAASDTLERASDALARARTLAVQAANGTLSASDRSAIAAEVNQILESLVQCANEMHEDRYLFSGTKTDTPPIAVTRDSDGLIQGFSYQGSDGALAFPLGRSRQIEVSVNGQAAFLDSDVLEAVKSFRDHLLNDEGLTEEETAAALRDDLSRLTVAQQDLLHTAGEVGSRVTHLDMIGEQTDRAITRATDALSDFRDADAAQIAFELQREETILQALLNAAGRIMNVSLMDYLE